MIRRFSFVFTSKNILNCVRIHLAGYLELCAWKNDSVSMRAVRFCCCRKALLPERRAWDGTSGVQRSSLVDLEGTPLYPWEIAIQLTKIPRKHQLLGCCRFPFELPLRPRPTERAFSRPATYRPRPRKTRGKMPLSPDSIKAAQAWVEAEG